jgi:hypothetical protein
MTRRTDVEDRRLRRKTAAFRLKHDVGKALRWSAPEGRETDAASLRKRLAADLLPSTSGGAASGGGTGRDVLKIFFEWKREEGAMFDPGDPDLQALEGAMAVVARLAPRLSSLEEISFSSLLSLDSACVEGSRACTAFYRRVAVEEGPEIVRPLGRRGSGT